MKSKRGKKGRPSRGGLFITEKMFSIVEFYLYSGPRAAQAR